MTRRWINFLSEGVNCAAAGGLVGGKRRFGLACKIARILTVKVGVVVERCDNQSCSIVRCKCKNVWILG